MKSLILVTALILSVFESQAVLAQESEMSLEQLQAKNAEKLSRERLEQLMPGARVMRSTAGGGELSWTNNPDGKFLANDRQTRSGGMRHRSGFGGTAPGTWRISEDGQYCVDIEWALRDREKWCRDIYQVNSHYYMIRKGKGDGGNKAMLLEIKKK